MKENDEKSKLLSDQSSSNSDEAIYEQWADQRTKIVILTSLPALLSPITTTLYLPMLPIVIDDLDTTEELISLTISLYTIAIGTCPLFYGPFSDRFGRKKILITSLIFYVITSVLCGISPNIEYLIVFRLLQAMGTSAAVVVGAGSISDVFPPKRRGFAMGWFATTALTGPIIGPILGGFIGDLVGWRWLFHFLAFFSAIILLAVIFLLPETLNPHAKKRSPNPFVPLRFLSDVSILICASINSFMMGVLYLGLLVFPLVMEKKWDLSPNQVGLAFLPFGVSILFGTVLGGRIADYGDQKHGRGGRITASTLGTVCFAFATVAFGWGLETNFALTMVSSGLVGFFYTFPKPGISTFCIEAFPTAASSVTATLTFTQFFMAFVCTTIGPLIWKKTGYGWLFLVLGDIILLNCIPFFSLVLTNWDFRFKPR